MPEELPDETVGAVEPNQTQDQTDTTDWQKRYTDTHANWNTLNEQMSRFKSDPNAVIEFIRETHPDLLAEDEPDEDLDEFEPDEEERPLTRAEFNAWKTEQEQNARQQTAQQQYESDLKTFLNGRELNPIAERAIRAAPVKTPEELKKVVDEVLEYDNARSSKPRPRVPHVPSSGQAGTDTPNWSEMTQGEINTYLAERVRAEQSQI